MAPRNRGIQIGALRDGAAVGCAAPRRKGRGRTGVSMRRGGASRARMDLLRVVHGGNGRSTRPDDLIDSTRPAIPGLCVQESEHGAIADGIGGDGDVVGGAAVDRVPPRWQADAGTILVERQLPSAGGGHGPVSIAGLVLPDFDLAGDDGDRCASAFTDDLYRINPAGFRGRSVESGLVLSRRKTRKGLPRTRRIVMERICAVP